MSKFTDEFKTFIMRGNVMDMAVGVIIGGAFQAIITSAVDDIIMPVISLVTGGIDFSNLFIQFGGGEKFATLTEAKEAGVACLGYGNFITAVLNFLIMAFVIFTIVKGINKMNDKIAKKEEAPAAEPTTKVCPYCLSEIPINATKCAHCTSDVE